MKEFEAHILVVDDDKGIRELVKQYLDEYGFITSTAQNAEDAIDKVNQIKFDLNFDIKNYITSLFLGFIKVIRN